MKVKLNDIINADESIQYLRGIDLPAKLSYKVSKLILALAQEYDIIQQERRKIIEKYGARDENGELVSLRVNQYSIAMEYIEEANTELNDLMNTEVELNIAPLTLDELEPYKITPKYMLGLMPFIEE